MLPNFQISRRSKSHRFFGGKISVFVTCSFLTVYERRQLPSPWGGLEWGPREALPGLQRGPYCNATSAPLHCRKAVVATPRGPYGMKTVAFPDKKSNHKYAEISVPEKP